VKQYPIARKKIKKYYCISFSSKAPGLRLSKDKKKIISG
jgi:hypothetical protein